MLQRIAISLLLLSVFITPMLHSDIPLDSLLSRYQASLTRTAYPSRYKISKNGISGYIAIGVSQAIINGKAHTLDAPPVFRDGTVYVPDAMEAILQQAFVRRSDSYWQTVTLDPGHGGKDPGAISPNVGTHETDVVLDIAKKVKALLQAQGVKVNMTRDTDIFIPLENRARAGNQSRSHLFVSIHADACDACEVSGVEVFYGADWPKSNINVASRAYYLAGNMDLNHFVTGSSRGQYSTAQEVFFFKMMLAESNRAGQQAASGIVNHLAAGLRTDNRGTKTKNLRVIRRSAGPAILVECGFLTNPAEARNLSKPAYRSKAAKLIAEGILRFLREQVKAE